MGDMEEAKPKHAGGRPSKVSAISATEVQKLAKIGCTQTEIADFFSVSHSQISRSFAQPYKRGLEQCKMSLRRKQLSMANKGNCTMLIWLGKQLLGQREPKHELELGGRDGGPIEIVNYAGASKK